MVLLIVSGAFVLLAVLALVVLLVLRARRGRLVAPVENDEETSIMRLEPGELAALDQTSVDLHEVMSDAGVALYIPTADPDDFIVLASPSEVLPGRSSRIPHQMAKLAVAGQAAVESLVEAGRLSGRLVTVDRATAEAIRAGTMVTDAAGKTMGVIRGGNGRWAGITRIKPLSGSLVRSASAGPAILGAIAAQAQMAQIEAAISEVRDVALAIRAHLETHERAEVEGRRASLANAYRTATETGHMTQATWDGIQHLEDLLLKDVALADGRLAEAVRTFTGAQETRVSRRLTWLADGSEPVAAALASVADARRAFVQFSVLRLWWLAVSEDASLASRQTQLGEVIGALPDHVAARDAVQVALQKVTETSRVQRTLAPRKHKELDPRARDAEAEMFSLPWQVVDINQAPALVERSN